MVEPELVCFVVYGEVVYGSAEGADFCSCQIPVKDLCAGVGEELRLVSVSDEVCFLGGSEEVPKRETASKIKI